MSKSGFSTLNRWLGRKNKDKSVPNGKLSKSSTNLSISSTNINETSQLEYNRITPLPAATTNAPFEQTFRITVLLPKDQLYVTRLGARIPLSKLLELVCDNKLLDAEKYEFRNPVDSSQVYSCDLTIGAVGLSEIRLCHKSESYDSFNADEIMKLHRTSVIRESLTSSEFSSRNSKHTTKTTSPYSSSNSLNSMDSSGVHYMRAPKMPPTGQPKMAAPPRKKRAAPRPPSQIAIPEKSPLIIENGEEKQARSAVTNAVESPLTTKDFSVSTPNLSSSTLLHSDINGNDCNGHLEGIHENDSMANSNGYTEDTVLYAQVQKKNALNLHSGSVQNLPSSPSPSPVDGESNAFPEPSPRKKIVLIKKKTVAPPAPQPRCSMYSEDSVSIASTNLSSAPSTPVALTTPVQDFTAPPPKPVERDQAREVSPPVQDVPKPQPRITTTTTTTTTLLNATDLQADLKNLENDTGKAKTGNNVSKVLLNRTPTPEPRSLSCEPPDTDTSCYETHIEHLKQPLDDDNVSKQADSGIGEPVPSPIPDSLPSEVSTLDVKSNFESSSDDDDMVKVYNFKLGKTLVKPLNETKTLEELTVMNDGQEETDSELNTPLILTQTGCSTTPSETSSWNFAIPISPPPNFADNKFGEAFEQDKQEQENPITPKIMERPILNFEVLKQETAVKTKPVENSAPTPTTTPVTPMENIVGELSAIIQEKGLDTLIKKPEEAAQIESAKPNTLTNFTISSGTQSTLTKPKEVMSENPQAKTETGKVTSTANSPTGSADEEKLYRKRNSVTSLKQRRSITRSDSFHTTAISTDNNASTAATLSKRTSSQLSLDQAAAFNLNRRRSSSELSIGDTPSLQSLEVMKTILNSRKNSLANSGGEEELKSIEVNTRRPSDELKFASLELKIKPAETPNQEQTKHIHKEKTQEQPKENMKKLWESRVQLAEESNNQHAKRPNEEVNNQQLLRTSEPESMPTENHVKVEEKPKELPKVYRYSGPPSINFSTWNERPKVQVQAIKNEGDYIFGGKLNDAKTVPRSYRMSTPAGYNEQYDQSAQSPPVAPKPATIQRMGIPEKEYKVPVVVKPIKDVIVEGTERTIAKTPAEVKVVVNGDTKPAVQRPTIESVFKPQTQTIVNTHTSTLPRTNKRFSTPVTIATPVNPGQQLLRSTSIKQQERDTKTTIASVEAAPQAAPFGQNTLRRTGLKEKILAKEEQEQQKAINVSTQPAKAPTTITPPKALTNGELKFTTAKFDLKPPTSAKLHLNLQKSTSITVNTFTNNNSTTPTTTTPTFKPKPQTPKTAPVISSTVPAPPKPPSPPMMAISLKPVTAVRTPTNSEDPRDQLLAAIRNFKKDELKKS